MRSRCTLLDSRPAAYAHALEPLLPSSPTMSSSIHIQPSAQPHEMPEKTYNRSGMVATELSGRQYGIDGIEDDFKESDGLNSNRFDQRDMQRLGRQQELRRNFRSLSMLSFTIIVQATWEFVLVSLTQGLTTGGISGMTWSFIWTVIGFLPIVASLAEMASMAPTSGGQYHWVSEFAPLRYQKFLSYMAGWQSTLAWQAGNASGPFVTGGIMQGLIFVNNENYGAPAWQGTLLVIANVLLVFCANIWGARFIPYAQNGLLGFHVLMFFAVIIPLWVLAPHASAKEVFVTGFTNSAGWGSMGVSLLVGQISAIWGCIGSDAAAHMSEETKDAGLVVPQAMLWSFVINGVLGIALVTTVCFALPDISSALDDSTGWPFLYAFKSAMSNSGVNAVTTGVLILIFASNVSYSASTGRETFAFARDNGLPFAKWIGKVHPKLQIPANAIGLSCLISILLSLINIGSTAAFNAIISLNTVALMLTYTISIGCVLWRRIACPETLPPARWSLGRWGLPINIAGVLYAFWAFFWAFWPNSVPVDVTNFNWSSVMFVGVTILSLIMYVFQGRHVYDGPAVLVEGRRNSAKADSERASSNSE